MSSITSIWLSQHQKLLYIKGIFLIFLQSPVNDLLDFVVLGPYSVLYRGLSEFTPKLTIVNNAFFCPPCKHGNHSLIFTSCTKRQQGFETIWFFTSFLWPRQFWYYVIISSIWFCMNLYYLAIPLRIQLDLQVSSSLGCL